MTRDASLTEFGVDERGDADATGGQDDGDESGEGGDGNDGTSAPVAPTSKWNAEPVACTNCATPVRRSWRSETGFVCIDCKDW